MLRKLLLASILSCTMASAPVAPVTAPVQNIPVQDVTVYESTINVPEQVTVRVNKESDKIADSEDWMVPAETLNTSVANVSECFVR